MLEEASEFFKNFLFDCQEWCKDGEFKYERGVWVRSYGIPLHAWNASFFEILVPDLGKLLKIDEISLARGRVDYARVLISTHRLEEKISLSR